MPQEKDDEALLEELVNKLARDSMRKRETKEQWRQRLNALKESLDVHIDAIGED